LVFAEKGYLVFKNKVREIRKKSQNQGGGSHGAKIGENIDHMNSKKK
jgi:hypothetical protein